MRAHSIANTDSPACRGQRIVQENDWMRVLDEMQETFFRYCSLGQLLHEVVFYVFFPDPGSGSNEYANERVWIAWSWSEGCII